MANKHYKLPLDDVMDKDITDWIESMPRTKKGEVIRYALRYYMAEQKRRGAEGEEGWFLTHEGSPANTTSSKKLSRSLDTKKVVVDDVKIPPANFGTGIRATED